jgi:hypothetical protein
MDYVPQRLGYYTYRCKNCGLECTKKTLPTTGLTPTKLGDYGNNATPTPTTFSDTVYTARSIAFAEASGSDPAKLTDSFSAFGDNHIQGGWTIEIETTSGVNDGTYTIADRGVSRGEILLDEDDSLTTETAEDAGEVTISRVIYKPNITTGCPFCGSLNSR